MGVQPVLSRWKALPAYNRCLKVHLLPFGMARRFGELIDLRKECVDEADDPTVSVSVLVPIVASENRPDRNRIDGFAFSDKPRIILVRKSCRKIVPLKRLRVWDLKKMESIRILQACHHRNRFGRDRYDRRK